VLLFKPRIAKPEEPTTNLLYNSGAINLTTATDIYGKATKTDLGNGKYRFVNDGSGVSGIRLLVNLSDLIDGDTYGISLRFENNNGGTINLDWCDLPITEGVSSSTASSGKIYGIGTRADYTTTYKFVDINLTSGQSIDLYNDQVEHNNYTTAFTNSSRNPGDLSLTGRIMSLGTSYSYIIGSLGIGTTSPSQKLDVNGSVNIGGSLAIGSIGSSVVDNNRVLTSSAAGSGIVQYIDTTNWDKSTANDISVATNGLQLIGTTAVGLGGTLTQANFTNINIGAGSSGLAILGLNNNTQALVIRQNGNVGIGTTGPTIKLAIFDNDTGLHSTADGALDIYSNNVKTMSIRSGNVGIGTTSPGAKLEVNGNIYITRGTNAGLLTYTGNLDKAAMTYYQNNSDGIYTRYLDIEFLRRGGETDADITDY